MEALSSFWLGIMVFPSSCSIVAFALLLGLSCGADVRVVDAAGGLSNAGLLQVKTETGYGSVCGANAASAEVTRQEHLLFESVYDRLLIDSGCLHLIDFDCFSVVY